ncbi:MAG: alpha/beta hydrolase family esterase [Solimonas sp.]
MRILMILAALLGAAPAFAATVPNFTGAYTGLIGDLTVSDPKKAGNLMANTVVVINGRLVTLPRGTAAFDISFVHAGETRRFLVVRPEPANSGAAGVFVLHGTGGTPEAQFNLTIIGANVVANGFWAILPEAADGGWNDDPGYSNGNDDVGFNAKIIDIATGYLGLDADRLYFSGLSDGAFMVERLGCELSDRVAAVALIAGTISTGLSQACAPATPRSIILVNGTADPIVPYNGGRVGVQSAPVTWSFWLGRHNCNAASTVSTAMPDTAADGTTTTLQRNIGCGSGGEVRQYIVNNGGHTWPGGRQYLSESTIGKTSQDFSINAEMWNFFVAHPRQ